MKKAFSMSLRIVTSIIRVGFKTKDS